MSKKNMKSQKKFHNESISCQASHSAPFFKEKLIQKGAVTCLSFFDCFSSGIPSLTVEDSFLLSGFIQNSITFEEGSAREMGHSLNTLGPVVGPEECISVSHLHTNIFSNRRLRLYCFTEARQVDIEMMIYTDLSFQVSLAHTFSRAVHTEGPRAQFWTTAHIGCFWMTLQDVTHIRYKREPTARGINRHPYMCLHFSRLFGKHFTSVLWNFDWIEV